MRYGIWKEDIAFFNLYDHLINSKIINAPKSYQIISELEGNQLPIGTKKSFLKALDEYNNNFSLNKSDSDIKVSRYV